MNINNLKTYDDLEEYLSEWKSFEDDNTYDFNGIVILLSACLRNINKYALEEEINDLPQALQGEEKKLLLKISSMI
jgi:hypothetical protein